MIKTNFLMRSATWHNFNVILLNCGMNIQIWKIQDKSSYWHKNNNTSSILTKQLCLLKITWPKKVSPTNHIVWLCSIFTTQSIQIMHNPLTSQAIVSYFWCSQTFSIFTQYMSVSHGHSTLGGIEYDDGGYVEKTKKGKVSHQRG